MCLAQGRNAVTTMRLEPAAPRSRIKHSTTEPLRSLTLYASSKVSDESVQLPRFTDHHCYKYQKLDVCALGSA